MPHRTPVRRPARRTSTTIRRTFLAAGACKHCGRTGPCSCGEDDSDARRGVLSPEAHAQRRVRELGACLYEAFANNDRMRVESITRSVLNIAHAMAGFPEEHEVPPAFVFIDDLDYEAIPSVPRAMDLCCRVFETHRLDGVAGPYGARMYLIAFSSLMCALNAGQSLGGDVGGGRYIENSEMYIENPEM